MNSILPIPGVRPRAGGTDILLTVRDDMTLLINPAAIAMAGNHNSALFVVDQPAALDALACRAEVRTTAGTSYRLVQNGEFALTADIAVPGIGQLQLVYGDGDINIKTTVVQFYVAPSLDALDPSAPEFQDGLAELQNAAFAGAGTVGTQLVFVNIGGREVARVQFPGSGLDEAAADLLYLRKDGGLMAGVVTFAAGQGMSFLPGASAIQEQGGTLTARHGVGPFSAVITLNDGDARYPTFAYAEARYVSLDGGSLAGPITAIYDSSAPAASNLVTRQYVNSEDAKYLPRAGGQMDGNLSMAPGQRIISAMGAGNQPTLCIGSNDSGFWRSAQSIILESGFAVIAILSPAGNTFYSPITLPAAPITNLQAATKQYVDERRAPSFKFDIPLDFLLTSAWQTLYSVPYQIPRGGLSRVRVTVAASVRSTQQGGLGAVGISCQPDIAIDRIERQAFVYNLNGVSTGFTVDFTVEVNGASPILTLQAVVLATNPGTNDITIIGGDTFNQQRSQITIEDLGAR